jgi:hypothetical protein
MALVKTNICKGARAMNHGMPSLTTHNFTVTLSNPRTGQHRTFKLSTAQRGDMKGKRIISLLIGPDNSNNFKGFAFVNEQGQIVDGKGQPGVWKDYRGGVCETYARMLTNPDHWAARGIQYLVSSRCRRCNRKLTVPESILSGLGPECASKV